MYDYWHKQTTDKPLYPDLLWSRPENRAHAGKLLIVGGNAQGFAAVGEAYSFATKAGIGTARAMLPDSLQKTVGKIFPAAEFCPSTPSGSFSQQALAEVLSGAVWSDGVLLPGDLGRNSETAILLERLAAKYNGQLTATKNAADYFITIAPMILQRPQTTLVLSFAQLQKLGVSGRLTQAFTFDMDLLRIVEGLRDLTKQYPVTIVVKHLETIFVAYDGGVTTTKLSEDQRIWRLRTAAFCSVWWLQNPSQTMQAVTTGVYDSFQ